MRRAAVWPSHEGCVGGVTRRSPGPAGACRPWVQPAEQLRHARNRAGSVARGGPVKLRSQNLVLRLGDIVPMPFFDSRSTLLWVGLHCDYMLCFMHVCAYVACSRASTRCTLLSLRPKVEMSIACPHGARRFWMCLSPCPGTGRPLLDACTFTLETPITTPWSITVYQRSYLHHY